MKEAEALNYCWWLKEAYSQAWTKGPRCFNRNSLCVNQMSDPTEQLHLQPDLWKISTASLPIYWTSHVSNAHFCTVSSTNKGLASMFTTWKLTDKIFSWTQVNLHWFFKRKIQRHSIWTTAKWERCYCLLSTKPGCSRLSAFPIPDCTSTWDNFQRHKAFLIQKLSIFNTHRKAQDRELFDKTHIIFPNWFWCPVPWTLKCIFPLKKDLEYNFKHDQHAPLDRSWYQLLHWWLKWACLTLN